jgi:hypothetical protein
MGRLLGALATAAALLALLLSLAACSRPDSILLVEVAGSETLAPTQFNVVVVAGLDMRAFKVPSQPVAPLSLPTSFSIELDHAVTAPVTVQVEAFGSAGESLGSGTTVQEHIAIGGQTIISVFITSGGASAAAPAGGAGAAGGLDAAAD